AGLEWAVKMDKPYFIGQRSVVVARKSALKQKLVGFTLDTADAAAPAPKECHLVIRNGAIAGRVTSISWSDTLSRYVGLAYVATDLAAEGTPFFIRADGGVMVQARVVPTPFYDAAGERQKASD
ncbi:MAG: aminomethyltransferase family protein, partial [Burkholderiales bacterium]|nr:aminomethyltransferase family protein [Burkholderiales bacterium]